MAVNGGTSTRPSVKYSVRGGYGGQGTITQNKLKPDLNYIKKELTLNINETHNIDKSKINFINQNGIQTPKLNVGNIKIESLNPSIAKVDSNGIITGISKGMTKIKITDTTNNISTYIYVTVKDGIEPNVQEGLNFTIALKKNGTVWGYGLNDMGQLGNGTNDNSLEPVKIDGLNNIQMISTGTAHGLALNENKEVYSWGANNNGQLGNGENLDSNVPIKVDGLSKIKKIDAYKNESIALDEDGRVYVWGERYSSFPQRIVFPEKIVDISGDIMLTESGNIYDIPTLEKVEGISNISKISAGVLHYLALNPEGEVYAWGINSAGECGIGTSISQIVGVSENIVNISAGNKVTLLQTETGRVFVLGDNSKSQLGIEGVTSIDIPTQIILAGNAKIEKISAGEGSHNGLVDENGFVWHSGNNNYGELGFKEKANSVTFAKVGETIITIDNKDKIYLGLGDQVTLNCILENTFNLKIDMVDNIQNNFTLQNNNQVVSVNNRTITALDYGTSTVTIIHTPTGITKEITIVVAKKMESLVQGFRDEDLPDGEYQVIINGMEYTVELINYYDNMHYTLDGEEDSKIVELGDDSTDYKTLVVKYHKNLNIDEGVTLTAKSIDNLTYKKGMYICVLGDTVNNGSISMTKKGTYNQEGEDVFLWKNIDSTYEYVPEKGGAGGIGVVSKRGNAGEAGIARSTGGGGSRRFCRTRRS